MTTVSQVYGSRKDDHVRLAVEQHHQRGAGVEVNQFDDVRFVHDALAGIAESAVSLTTEVAGTDWAAPLYINAMTGGSTRTGEVNRGLAIAARQTGVPIASGSMSAFLADPDLAPTYRVLRDENPDGFVVANVNANATVDMAKRAVDLIAADALQIHINTIQEIVMPEGDRDFSHWPSQIGKLAEALDVPVIVKEVGFGMTRSAVRRLADLGVTIADVSGRGGTNFATIENARRPHQDFAYLRDWGQSAPACLIDDQAIAGQRGVTLLASGGVRQPLDVVRALALGARAVGVSGYFLSVLEGEGVDALVSTIADWIVQIRQLMVVLGAPTVPDLVKTDVLVSGQVAEFARLRGIDPGDYARRATP
ncbi:type 2 isopentenyl-diphosphate Delta-isomerase [Antrihabitans cavernicola]|uniref:Isopentenyl-diphosphate delta-isomerase n=1 Tax=Antrihabitans cavernicola TaxID=2495913 RepID=A0A5A7S6W2_9NOCA|nr:type 2 isopentenyl-diphosphate Delta-isomerase [Spelaeibacter cavernicola]KAA0020140.1 type 2 isopentenyl-diphosphate Delta-isomerase [Spelaeibacter cavernicola]